MTCPTPRRRRHVEWTLVGGLHNASRVELPKDTTQVHLGECVYVRDDQRGKPLHLYHVDHEEA